MAEQDTILPLAKRKEIIERIKEQIATVTKTILELNDCMIIGGQGSIHSLAFLAGGRKYEIFPNVNRLRKQHEEYRWPSGPFYDDHILIYDEEE